MPWIKTSPALEKPHAGRRIAAVLARMALPGWACGAAPRGSHRGSTGLRS